MCRFLNLVAILIVLLSNEGVCLKGRRGLTASSETLIWLPVNKTAIDDVAKIEEAFILAPVDYEAEFSPFIPVNIRRFTKLGEAPDGRVTNLWMIPGGPGQSTKVVESYLSVLLPLLPAGAAVYAIDHRGLGKSTPLADDVDRDLLLQSQNNHTLLPQILERKQFEMGITTSLVRALRIENVARDFRKGLHMVQRQDAQTRGGKNYLLAISYGTLVARRLLQLAPNDFEAVMLDGLASIERIEFSNESDRTIEEFCKSLPGCNARLEKFVSLDDASGLKIRSLIPKILSSPGNSCISTFKAYLANFSVCEGLHDLMNSALLQGRTSIKMATLRLLFEMIACDDPTGFSSLMKVLDKTLRHAAPVNQFQSAGAIEADKALSKDELVFEVISALERYDATTESMNICFNKKHLKLDDFGACPRRIFDPCKFFLTSYDRKMALYVAYNGTLPPITLQSPWIVSNRTRVMVLAGSMDFNTPTHLSRQITNSFMSMPDVRYHEFFGMNHGTFGSSHCDAELFSDFLSTNGMVGRTGACVARWNRRNQLYLNRLGFQSTLSLLAERIKSAKVD